MIIRRFDENIGQKAERTQISELYSHIEKKCVDASQMEKYQDILKQIEERLRKKLKD